jgi:hypothetical protein
MESVDLNEHRCSCGRLLFKGALKDCTIEIKCRRCGKIKTIGFCNGVEVENKENQ